MLSENIERWEQELFEKGIQKGIEKGIEKGIATERENSRNNLYAIITQLIDTVYLGKAENLKPYLANASKEELQVLIHKILDNEPLNLTAKI